MKKFILICFVFVASFQTIAQQDAMYTHYMYNTLGVNPGYAGSRDALTATLLHRNQWASFDGAPKVNTFTLHTPMFNNKIGMGFSFINDRIGPVKNNSINIDLAYRLKISNDGTLAFGLKAGANVMSADLTNVSLDENQDNAFSQNIGTDILPNFGFGLYYSTSKFYVGASIPKLIENQYESMASSNSNSSQKRHFYFIGGTVIDINKDIEFKPTSLIKFTQAARVQLDITGTFLFKDKFSVGAMWRSSDALGTLIGLNLNDQLSFGYSFDWSYNGHWAAIEQTVDRTSHELMLRFDMIYKNDDRIRSPRYF